MSRFLQLHIFGVGAPDAPDTQASELLDEKSVGSMAVRLTHSSKIYVATSLPQGGSGIDKTDGGGSTVYATALQCVHSFILSLLVSNDVSKVYVSTHDSDVLWPRV